MCGGGGGSSSGVKYQQQQDAARDQKTKDAVDEIYKVFGFTADGDEINVSPNANIVDTTREAYDSQFLKEMMVDDPGWEWIGDNSNWNKSRQSLQEIDTGPGYDAWLAQHNQQASRDQEAYNNSQKWDDELSEVYDAVMGHHRNTLDKSRQEISDSTMTQVLRQGMMGSHLQNQYDHQITDTYNDGLGQIDSIATSAKEKAKSGIHGVMNNAVSQVHADNFEAANAATLNQNIANSIDSSQSQATSQNIGNLFSDLADAYERRQTNKGNTLANQSYYSTSGSNGVVS